MALAEEPRGLKTRAIKGEVSLGSCLRQLGSATVGRLALRRFPWR